VKSEDPARYRKSQIKWIIFYIISVIITLVSSLLYSKTSIASEITLILTLAIVLWFLTIIIKIANISDPKEKKSKGWSKALGATLLIFLVAALLTAGIVYLIISLRK
jgi:heme/copper-type cytochrome/quinol oxidase subunit 4